MEKSGSPFALAGAWPSLDVLMTEVWAPPPDPGQLPRIPVYEMRALARHVGQRDAGARAGDEALLGCADFPGPDDLIRLAGTMASVTPVAGGGAARIRVAAATADMPGGWDMRRTYLVAARIWKRYGRVDYYAFQRMGRELARCCAPGDGGDGSEWSYQRICAEQPRPWSRRCSAHQDEADANRRLVRWREGSRRLRDERDAAVRYAAAHGISSRRIAMISGLAEATVNGILGQGPTAGSPL